MNTKVVFFAAVVFGGTLLTWGCSRVQPTQAVVTQPSRTEGLKTARISFYSEKESNGKTASGKKFEDGHLIAAHRSLPFGTKVRIVNPENGREVIVTVADRGPESTAREFDISKKAAEELDMITAGVITAKYEILSKGKS